MLDEATAGDRSCGRVASGRCEASPSSRSRTRPRGLLGVGPATGLPEKATVDAFHIRVAAAHQVTYLLTWNCKHLANATMRGTIEDVCRSEGLSPPIICTPEELPARRPS